MVDTVGVFYRFFYSQASSTTSIWLASMPDGYATVTAVSAVPEASTSLLMAAGLLSLGLFARSRRRG